MYFKNTIKTVLRVTQRKSPRNFVARQTPSDLLVKAQVRDLPDGKLGALSSKLEIVPSAARAGKTRLICQFQTNNKDEYVCSLHQQTIFDEPREVIPACVPAKE